MRLRELGESNWWSNSDIFFEDPNRRELKVRSWRDMGTAAETVAFLCRSSGLGALFGAN